MLAFVCGHVEFLRASMLQKPSKTGDEEIPRTRVNGKNCVGDIASAIGDSKVW